MNVNEHLLTCLVEEGVEVAKDATKALRFGLDDVNVLDLTGPTNRERIVDELNDLLGVAAMLVERGVLPANWFDAAKQAAKKEKVTRFMRYALKAGTLEIEG
jgi:hypothetical protein